MWAQNSQLKHELSQATDDADRLSQLIEDGKVEAELKHFRAIEALRAEHHAESAEAGTRYH